MSKELQTLSSCRNYIRYQDLLIERLEGIIKDSINATEAMKKLAADQSVHSDFVAIIKKHELNLQSRMTARKLTDFILEKIFLLNTANSKRRKRK